MSDLIQISSVFLVVLGVSVLMRLFKQPLIIGYIISGILVGPLFLDMLPKGDVLDLFSEFGIAFLLFLVGLHLSPKVIKEVGPVALITGIGQIVFTAVIGYFVAVWLGFETVTAIYIAIALTFSSTIIIMKLISDKDALEKLYGKISVGFLLVQDFVAILILIVVSSLASGTGGAGTIFFLTILKGSVLIFFLALLSHFVLPKFENFLSKSQEFLFLFSVSWGLGISMLFLYIGFSLEIGALIAGILLSLTSYSFEVGSKLKPLRDFFIISFFLILGSQMVFTNFSAILLPTFIFALLVVLGNPLIVMVLMGLKGFAKKTSFMAGLTVAQIGEFSLIFIMMGLRVGHISQEILSLITLVSLFTIFGCTYLIMYAEKVYKFFEKPLSVFERKKLKEVADNFKLPEYILLGENRIGFAIMEYWKKTDKNHLIVDFDPTRVKKLCSKGENCVFGDASSSSFLEEINLDKAKMIVSTIPERDTNLLLVKKIRERNKNSIIIVTANRISEVPALYSEGADFVVVANVVAGENLTDLISRVGLDKEKYKKEVFKQLEDFDKRLKF